jgi:hypothetical protein
VSDATFPFFPDPDSWETTGSRSTSWTSKGSEKQQTREFIAVGLMSPEEAVDYALNGAPPPDNIPYYIPFNPQLNQPGLLLESISATPLDTPETWSVTAQYKSLVRDDDGNDVDYTFSGTTSGQSQNITQGLDYRKFGNGPNFAGAINVTENGVDGVDIVIPKLEFQIDKVLRKSTKWFEYLMHITQLTGSVNAAPFGLFARGEVLYLGADFSVQGGGDTNFTHKFMASPNRTIANNNALKFGPISNVEKMGHDYLWVDYIAMEESGFVIREPRTVHVHQVYPYADFTRLRL